MRKRLASIAVLSLFASVSAPMTVFAGSKTTVSASTVVEHATLTPIGVGKYHTHGTALVTLNTKTHVLTVKVTATGLAPKSAHATHIHVAGYSYNKYILNNLVADSKGNATSTTVFHNVGSTLGKDPWLIIDHGPNLKNPVNAAVIAQGRVK